MSDLKQQCILGKKCAPRKLAKFVRESEYYFLSGLSIPF